MDIGRHQYDGVAQHMNRRRVIGGLGALATGGTMLALTPDGASAAVTVDGLEIPDTSFTAESVDPVVDVDIGYSYDAASSVVSALGFTLAVDGTVIAEDTLVTDATTLEETLSLSGAVTDSEAWSAADFQPEVASSVENDLTVSVTFDVLDDREESIVGDSASTTATVVVAHPQEATYQATVSGTGTIRTASE
jgi:hypothetical protein